MYKGAEEALEHEGHSRAVLKDIPDGLGQSGDPLDSAQTTALPDELTLHHWRTRVHLNQTSSKETNVLYANEQPIKPVHQMERRMQQVCILSPGLFNFDGEIILRGVDVLRVFIIGN